MVYGFALLRIKPFKEIHERATIHFAMPPRAKLRFIPRSQGVRDMEVGKCQSARRSNESEGIVCRQVLARWGRGWGRRGERLGWGWRLAERSQFGVKWFGVRDLGLGDRLRGWRVRRPRAEEHTLELQLRQYL